MAVGCHFRAFPSSGAPGNGRCQRECRFSTDGGAELPWRPRLHPVPLGGAHPELETARHSQPLPQLAHPPPRRAQTDHVHGALGGTAGWGLRSGGGARDFGGAASAAGLRRPTDPGHLLRPAHLRHGLHQPRRPPAAAHTRAQGGRPGGPDQTGVVREDHGLDAVAGADLGEGPPRSGSYGCRGGRCWSGPPLALPCRCGGRRLLLRPVRGLPGLKDVPELLALDVHRRQDAVEPLRQRPGTTGPNPCGARYRGTNAVDVRPVRLLTSTRY